MHRETLSQKGKKIIILLWLTTYISLCGGENTWVQVPAEVGSGIRISGARVSGGFALPILGVGNWTRFLCQNCKSFSATDSYLQSLPWILDLVVSTSPGLGLQTRTPTSSKCVGPSVHRENQMLSSGLPLVALWVSGLRSPFSGTAHMPFQTEKGSFREKMLAKRFQRDPKWLRGLCLISSVCLLWVKKTGLEQQFPQASPSVRKKCCGPARWIPPTAVSLLWEDFLI